MRLSIWLGDAREMLTVRHSNHGCLSDKLLETIMRVDAHQGTLATMKDALLKAYGISTDDLRDQFLHVKVQ